MRDHAGDQQSRLHSTSKSQTAASSSGDSVHARGVEPWIVRPAALGDLQALCELAQVLGPGMTTLPDDREALAAKIEASVVSFQSQAMTHGRQYMLVLEDQATGNLLGTAGVYPEIGHPFGFFSYRLTRNVHHSRHIGLEAAAEALHLTHDYTGLTEVGTLAVSPRARRRGAGRFLARSRYMLLAAFPHLFASHVIAELRGWQDPDGQSPFWSAVGERFLHMSFTQADNLNAVFGAGFVADLFPRYPICVNLLPNRARAAIGRAHATSTKALDMLTDEGFRFEGLVDVFDAGPQVIAAREEIRTVATARRAAGCRHENLEAAAEFLVASCCLEDFRVARAVTDPHREEVNFDNHCLHALRCSRDDELCISILH